MEGKISNEAYIQASLERFPPLDPWGKEVCLISPSSPNSLWEGFRHSKPTCRRDWSIRVVYFYILFWMVDSVKINHRTIVLWILWGWRFRSMTSFFCFQDAMPECAKERKLNSLPLWVIPSRYPPPTNSEIIICSFLWRAPYKPWLSTVGGPGIPSSHTLSLSTWRDSTWINGKNGWFGELKRYITKHGWV